MVTTILMVNKIRSEMVYHKFGNDCDGKYSESDKEETTK
jgi:hypothetical protein